LHRHIVRYASDDRGGRVVDGDALYLAAAVSAGIGRRVSPLDDILIGAGARDRLVAVGDDRRATAIVSGDNSAVIGRRHGAGALDRNIGRNAGNDRGRRVTDSDGLDLAAAVAAFIGCGVSAFDDELIDARAGVSLVAMRDDRDAAAV